MRSWPPVPRQGTVLHRIPSPRRSTVTGSPSGAGSSCASTTPAPSARSAAATAISIVVLHIGPPPFGRPHFGPLSRRRPTRYQRRGCGASLRPRGGKTASALSRASGLGASWAPRTLPSLHLVGPRHLPLRRSLAHRDGGTRLIHEW